MKYGDLSSVVQLGVGLHLGTALLQLYGDIGLQPLTRTIERTKILTRSLADIQSAEVIVDRLRMLESKYEIFRIHLFNEYKKYIFANSANAVILAIILVFISFFSDAIIVEEKEWVIVVILALSLLPAPISLGVLWIDASRLVKPMKEQADFLESQALSNSSLN